MVKIKKLKSKIARNFYGCRFFIHLCYLAISGTQNSSFSCCSVVFPDAYPLEQVDYFWKASDKQGIVILADEMNEYTLTDIKTKKGLVHYGTRSSSKSEFNLCAIVLYG